MVCRGYIQIGILTNTYTYKEEEKSVAKKKSIATVVTVDGHTEDGHDSWDPGFPPLTLLQVQVKRRFRLAQLCCDFIGNSLITLQKELSQPTILCVLNISDLEP